jgi:hypothetical protein
VSTAYTAWNVTQRVIGVALTMWDKHQGLKHLPAEEGAGPCDALARSYRGIFENTPRTLFAICTLSVHMTRYKREVGHVSKCFVVAVTPVTVPLRYHFSRWPMGPPHSPNSVDMLNEAPPLANFSQGATPFTITLYTRYI